MGVVRGCRGKGKSTCGKPKARRPWIQSALKPLSFSGEEESGRLWNLGVSSLLLAFSNPFCPLPPVFLFRPPPLSAPRPRVAAAWCDPGWSRRRGRAPPSAGKLCTFPRLPFVLSWVRWEGSETPGHLAPSWSLAGPGVCWRAELLQEGMRRALGTKAATPRPSRPGALASSLGLGPPPPRLPARRSCVPAREGPECCRASVAEPQDLSASYPPVTTEASGFCAGWGVLREKYAECVAGQWRWRGGPSCPLHCIQGAWCL